MSVFYITDVSRGRVLSCASINRAARLTTSSGFFFTKAEDLANEEFGGAHFNQLSKRFLGKEGTAEELFESMTGAINKVVAYVPPTKKRRKDTMTKSTIDIDLEDIIRINKDTDAKPRRPGSKVAQIFECYREGMKVSTWLEKVSELGGSLSNLRKDIAYGRISLEKKAVKQAA